MGSGSEAKPPGPLRSLPEKEARTLFLELEEKASHQEIATALFDLGLSLVIITQTYEERSQEMVLACTMMGLHYFDEDAIKRPANTTPEPWLLAKPSHPTTP